MTCVMRQEVDFGIAAAEPARQQVDGQRKTVHLREQRDEKRGKRAERAPVPPGPRRGETERENDEYEGIDDDQRPQAVRLFKLNDHVVLRRRSVTVLAAAIAPRLSALTTRPPAAGTPACATYSGGIRPRIRRAPRVPPCAPDARTCKPGSGT